MDAGGLSALNAARAPRGCSNDQAQHPGPQAETEGPADDIALAIWSAQTNLASELLSQIHAREPGFFEDLVIDVLLAMGYGTRRRDLARRLGRSSDGGVDGLISVDELGLDLIYLQAKAAEARKCRAGVRGARFRRQSRCAPRKQGYLRGDQPFLRGGGKFLSTGFTPRRVGGWGEIRRVDDPPQYRSERSAILSDQAGRSGLFPPERIPAIISASIQPRR